MIVGLSFATVLTLVLVPVLYSLIDDGAEWFKRVYTRPEEPQRDAGEPREPEEAQWSPEAPVAEEPKVRVPALTGMRAAEPGAAGG